MDRNEKTPGGAGVEATAFPSEDHAAIIGQLMQLNKQMQLLLLKVSFDAALERARALEAQ